MVAAPDQSDRQPVLRGLVRPGPALGAKSQRHYDLPLAKAGGFAVGSAVVLCSAESISAEPGRLERDCG